MVSRRTRSVAAAKKGKNMTPRGGGEGGGGGCIKSGRIFLLSTAICIPTLGVEVVRRLVSQMGKRCSKFSRENSINWMVWRWRKLKTKNLCKNLLKLVVCLLRHFFPPFTFSQCFVMQRAFQKLCQTISGKGPPEEWGLRLWLAEIFIHKLCPL